MKTEEKLLTDFLATFPKNELNQLTLDKYTGLNPNRNDFTYWIEHKLDSLGGIKGGQSLKFGIYKCSKDPKSTEGILRNGDYVWDEKYGKTKEKAFEEIKNRVIEVVKAVSGNTINYDAIEKINFSHDAYKWKIAFLYSNKRLVPVYQQNALKKAVIQISKGTNNIKNLTIAESQKILMDYYNKNKNTFNNDIYSFGSYIWKIGSSTDQQQHSQPQQQPSQPQQQSQPTAITINNSSKFPLNLILYGPPGTGKTYHTIDRALVRLGVDISKTTRNEIVEKFNELKRQGRIVFTTFHQSMSYEDFIEGIKPETDEDGNVTYEIKPGIFKQLCQKANPPQQDNFEEAWGKLVNDLIQGNTVQIPPIVKSNFSPFEIVLCKNGSSVKDVNNDSKTLNYKRAYEYYKTNQSDYYQSYYEGLINLLKRDYNLHDYKAPDYKSVGTDVNQETNHNTKPYVLIIDEINRGNVANIFGELITLIEEDKRLTPGKTNIYTVELPYSNEEFGVPSNLYIIGTMNTADRSVEALDTALRRRFSFEEMMPKPELLQDYNISDVDFTLADILDTINSRIEVLKDRDHLIGHSYFMIKDKDGNDIKELNLDNQVHSNILKNIFFDKIIPLLQEYFYGDYEKILMVLGNGFVEEKSPENKFAGNKTYDGLPEKVYHIVKPESFKLLEALDSMKIQGRNNAIDDNQKPDSNQEQT